MEFQKGNIPSRLKEFKNHGKDSEEMHRRRFNDFIKRRETKKSEQMLKRRNIKTNEEATINLPGSSSNVAFCIDDVIKGMQSSDENVLLMASQSAHTMLSTVFNNPVDAAINVIVPRCVDMLSFSHNPSLQFAAVSLLTHIVSGAEDQAMMVIRAGAIPRLVNLLGSDNFKLAEQAAWTLGNISGDGPEARDLVLEHNVIPLLLELINSDISVEYVRVLVWNLSLLFQFPPPKIDIVMTCLPCLCKLLSCSDNEIIGDTCWALYYITDGPKELIQAVIDTGVLYRFIDLISSSDVDILIPALKAIGNIVNCNDVQINIIVNAGMLPQVASLLRHSIRDVVREAGWIVYNVTAGDPAYIQPTIDAGILPALIDVIQKGELASQDLAAWAVVNLISNSTSEQLAALIGSGIIPAMCHLLTYKDCLSTIRVVLRGLLNLLLEAGKSGQAEVVANMVEECGGLDNIETLQNNDYEGIHQLCSTVLERFFQHNEDDEVFLRDTSQPL